MNLSLKGRVSISFFVANIVIFLLSILVFHFLNSLYKNIESITVNTNKVSVLTDEIRISIVSILKHQRRILTNNTSEGVKDTLLDRCEEVTSQLITLDTLYEDPEIRKIIARMRSYVDSLVVVLQKSALFHRDTVGIASVSELSDKILEAFSQFQDIQYFQNMEKDKKIEGIINETKRNMMITLIIGFLGTIIIGLIMPGKIALPFKKIKDAIRELQECNFDVSIYYNQDDEIGEVAKEMNKMIHNLKVFEELRTDRINVENRKFDILANMVRRPVLIANADSSLIYLNNRTYNLLQVQSDDVINKKMTDNVIPETIIDCFDLAIKRRSKIENEEIVIYKKIDEELEAKGPEIPLTEQDEMETAIESVQKEIEEKEKEKPILFQGYANVIPIRGKDSSLDYYLMVLSAEVFS